MDTLITKIPNYSPQHLTMKYKVAWHCTCDGFCKGSQFYAASRKTTILRHYKEKHENKMPWEFMNLNENSPNAKMCQKCHHEMAKEKNDPITDLQFAHKFSLRNGYGPVQMIPPPFAGEPQGVTDGRRLKYLMSIMTAAEEAAIRKVTPMLSIVRLKSGNLGAKGNTSCVLQQSKLAMFMPNRMQDVNYIILYHEGHQGLKSTKFRKRVIVEVLKLLERTGHPAWKMTIDEERLATWDEEGDLALLNAGLRIVRVNQDGGVEDAGDGGAAEPVVPLPDGDDAGPAPLQNSHMPEETHDTVVNYGENAEASAGQYGLLEPACIAAVNDVLNPPPDDHSEGQPVQGTLRLIRDTAAALHSDVLPVDGFVNMATTPYAWAMAFPTF